MNTATTTAAPTILITGALTGIGRATALAYARQGANLVISGRRDELGQALAAELRQLGAQAEYRRADVRHEEDVRKLVEFTVQRFGRLDVAVNNAGTEGTLSPLTEQSADNYTATFDTNVLGVLLSMKHEIRAMLNQGSGAIVNVSSIAGKAGFPGASVYAASKHAVEGLTKTAALEVATQGIRINAVAPGPIETDMLTRFTGGAAEAKAGLASMVPTQRIGTVDEIANTIVFLASPAASYITGVSLEVDGAYLAR